jgi:PKD repeat protein
MRDWRLEIGDGNADSHRPLSPVLRRPSSVLRLLIALCLSGLSGRAQTLDEALDATQLVWTTGGDAPWFGQTNTTFDGTHAAQSGAITTNQQTWIQTTVTGPVTLAYAWKVDSQTNADWLTFHLNGVAQTGRISGRSNWLPRVHHLVAGTHTSRWVFTNNFSTTLGQNAAWLDQVTLLPPVPVILVLGTNRAVVTNGAAPPSSATGADFGAAPAHTAGVLRTFFVTNAGNQAFAISAVTTVGLHAAEFTVVSFPSVVSPGGRSNLGVRFVPSAPGTRSAELVLSSDAPTNSLYAFAVRGAMAPALFLLGTNRALITNGTVVATAAHGTEYGTVAQITGSVSRTFFLTNAGTLSVSISDVTIGGANAADFETTESPSSISPGGRSNLTIRFVPSGGGPRLASVVIQSDDPAKSNYAFVVRGVGEIPPTLAVLGTNRAVIPSGSTTPSLGEGTDFGFVSTNAVRTFFITNSGTANLTVSGVSTGGLNAADFTVTNYPAVVSPGARSNLVVRFGPLVAGSRTATLSVQSNDPTNGVYAFAVQGIVVPLISVLGTNGLVVTNGTVVTAVSNGTDFGVTPAFSGSVVRSFFVRNSAVVDLEVSGATTGGPAAADFTVLECPALVSPGSSSNLVIHFVPATSGVRMASITLQNNDPIRTNYSFAVGGAGEIPPTIAILGTNRAVIPPGSTTPQAGDGTDFGFVASNVVRTFSITNSGTANLEISGIVTTGVNATDYTVISHPSVVSPGGRSNLAVRLLPSAGGLRSAGIAVQSNDPTNGVYTFLVSGVGAYQPSARFVWMDSPAPTAPYTNWETAAHTIQDAVDVAVPGDVVWVTNGVYATGGRAVYGAMTNRVAVTTPINVQSINGPSVTIIRGEGPAGSNAIRCVYLGSNSYLAGFTLSEGATASEGDIFAERSGGGAWCTTNATLSNCTVRANGAASYGGGVYRGILIRCSIIENSSVSGGGGSWASRLEECSLIENTSGGDGGGALNSALYGCIVESNSSSLRGGGASSSWLSGCMLRGNSASGGGGAQHCTLWYCSLYNNTAISSSGGGAGGGTLYSCRLVENSGVQGGGGAGANLYNCTLVGNRATEGGGVFNGALYNSIAWYNSAPDGANWKGASLLYSCTTPLAPGVGNIDDQPMLASVSHLSTHSPCIGQGHSSYSSGTDIDGEPWEIPPSMGCDEVRGGAATSDASVAIFTLYTNVSAGFVATFAARIEGPTTASRWDFGDGTTTSNEPYATHGWSSVGRYAVTLTAVSDRHSDGLSATAFVDVVAAPVHYVARTSLSPAFPYTSWGTAATSIQDAVDAALIPGARVLVSNGVYDTGGRAVNSLLTNRVALDRPVSVSSVNGAAVTVIKGVQPPGSAAVRCAYVGEDARLEGFTLTNGATRTDNGKDGGGAWCEPSGIVSGCTIVGCSAYGWGGGVYGGRVPEFRTAGKFVYCGLGGQWWSSVHPPKQLRALRQQRRRLWRSTK